MDLIEAMTARHSVRSFLDRPLDGETVAGLRQAVDAVNAESGLRFLLFTDEPTAFEANKPHYGNFKACRNYLAIPAPAGAEEAVGYYGEKLVLQMQTMGLNTCWVALSYHKGAVRPALQPGEKLHAVIALGYGETQGTAHRSKPAEKVAALSEASPDWFRRGVEAALLAPTAINQQQFYFRQVGADGVSAKAKLGPCSRIDLGIAKYHFELGAGTESFSWVR